ncbi:MAG: hypothetical protein K2X77_11760 [Candidatus Obscuribacterales bacterium]|nr:hypothetical protein [Candidatus Obscuribacterales bacterium]
MRQISLLLALMLTATTFVTAKTASSAATKGSNNGSQDKGSQVHGSAPNSDADADKDKAFNDIDGFFVRNYGAFAGVHQSQLRPAIVITGFKYRLLTEKGEADSFEAPDHVSPALKAIAHLGPCFFAIGSAHWNDLKDKSWKGNLTDLKAKLETALSSADQYDWSSEAWPGGEEKLKNYAKEALVKAKEFADKLIAKGEFERTDYSEFATSFTPYMVSLFYLEALSGTYHTIKKLNEWKAKLGEDAWNRMYVVIGGSSGRTTAGLTKETNPAALALGYVMDPERVTTHILLAPGAMNTDDALQSLGMVMNAHDLAELSFVTPETQKAGGFYSALRTFDVPLADYSLKNILRDLREGKARDPVLGLGPDKPI